MKRVSPAWPAALVAAATCIAAPLAAEVTRSTEDGFVSRNEVVVDATTKDVWLALISPATWWQSAHTWSGDAKNLTLTPQAGGCFCETIPEVDEPGRITLQGSVEHMRVVQAYPESALRMLGSLGPLQSEPVNGVLTIAISKVAAGTRIVFEYNVGGAMRYEVPVIAKAVDGVMAAQIAALAKPLGVVAASAAEPAAASSSDDAAKSDAGPAASPRSAVPPPKVPAAIPAPKPTSKPSPKPTAVDDAFGDLGNTRRD